MKKIYSSNKRKIKKIIVFLFLIIFLDVRCGFTATNTKSSDLESSSSQSLSINDVSQTGLSGFTELTISLWFKAESFGTNGLVCKYAGNASDGAEYLFSVEGTGSNIGSHFKEVSGSSFHEYNTSYSFSTATWYHIALVFDGPNETIKHFVNGSQNGTTDTSTGYTQIQDGTSIFTIGGLRPGVWAFDGLIDEVTVWSEAKTDSEISNLYNSGDGVIHTGSETNLEGYWRMEDDFTDETSNGNDLTNNNSVTFSTDVPFSGSAPAIRRIFFIN